MALNRFEFIGNVAQPIGILVKDDERKIAKIRIAIDKSRSKDSDADFFTVTAFGKLAEICIEYLNVGREILVIGHLEPSSYTNKNGDRVSGIDLIADSIEFLRGGFKPKEN